jgi:DNA adenine methylase
LDNCPEVLEAFDGFNIEPFDLQYGMNNYRQSSAAIGKEVLITNY